MGPRAGEAHVEVKGGRVLEGKVGPSESGGRSGVTAGGIGRGELGHHELPRGVPCRTDGGDEESRRERWAPEELGYGGEERGVWGLGGLVERRS